MRFFSTDCPYTYFADSGFSIQFPLIPFSRFLQRRLERNEPCQQVRKRFAFCSAPQEMLLSRHSPCTSKSNPCRFRASSMRLCFDLDVHGFGWDAMSHADRLANASLFARCHGIRRIRPNQTPVASEQARRACVLIRTCMAHC